jgi:signal transduction histidine kinase/ligand-binding sensor protein
MAYTFTDLVEVPRLQEMMISLHEATGLAISLTDADSNLLLTAGWQDICSKFHRACPLSEERCRQSDRFITAHPDEQTMGYMCLNGLQDYASPIVIEGQHLATLFVGQLFHEPPDEALFLRQAQEFGFDPAAYVEALHSVPVIPRGRFRAGVTFLTQLAQNLASAGLERRRLLAASAALEKSEEQAARLKEDLERRVAERTDQLTAANLELSLREASLQQAMASLSERQVSLSETTASLRARIAERERAEEALHRLNADLLGAQSRTNQVLHTLEAASGSLELAQVLEQIANELAMGMGLSLCIIYLFDANKNLLTPGASVGELSEEHMALLWQLLPHPGERSLAWTAVEGRNPIVSSDAQSDPRANQQLARALNIKSAMAIPIQRSDKLLGLALAATMQAHHTFTTEEVELAMGMANAAALAIENAKLYEATRRRLAESESFARVMVSLLRETELEEVLDAVCSEAQQLIGATGSAVLLLEEDGWLHPSHGTGSPLPVVDRLPVDKSLAGLAVQRGEPVLVNDPATQAQAYQTLGDVAALLAVPLRYNGGVIGVLDVVNKPGGFTGEDVRVTAVFASQAAMAIEHARLHRRAAQLAVVEERQRLARELHDSVTQALYGVTLFANAASAASSAGKQETAAGYLRKLRETAQEAMADMRLLIFQLHPPVLEQDGLVSALQARLAAVESRAGLQTEFRIDGDERRLPIEVEEELYWIAQEALNNVLKHAKARQATIHLDYKTDSATLEVRDNGIGFDTSTALEHGGVGLRNIEERVARARGRWTLESQPGQGTRVSVEVALASAQVGAG